MHHETVLFFTDFFVCLRLGIDRVPACYAGNISGSAWYGTCPTG
jgi:hypothetical protein